MIGINRFYIFTSKKDYEKSTQFFMLKGVSLSDAKDIKFPAVFGLKEIVSIDRNYQYNILQMVKSSFKEVYKFLEEFVKWCEKTPGMKGVAKIEKENILMIRFLEKTGYVLKRGENKRYVFKDVWRGVY